MHINMQKNLPHLMLGSQDNYSLEDYQDVRSRINGAIDKSTHRFIAACSAAIIIWLVTPLWLEQIPLNGPLIISVLLYTIAVIGLGYIAYMNYRQKLFLEIEHSRVTTQIDRLLRLS